MFAVRVYVAMLALAVLAAALATRGVGPAEAVVVSFPLLYMILEMREELREAAAAHASLPDGAAGGA